MFEATEWFGYQIFQLKWIFKERKMSFGIFGSAEKGKPNASTDNLFELFIEMRAIIVARKFRFCNQRL